MAHPVPKLAQATPQFAPALVAAAVSVRARVTSKKKNPSVNRPADRREEHQPTGGGGRETEASQPTVPFWGLFGLRAAGPQLDSRAQRRCEACPHTAPEDSAVTLLSRCSRRPAPVRASIYLYLSISFLVRPHRATTSRYNTATLHAVERALRGTTDADGDSSGIT